MAKKQAGGTGKRGSRKHGRSKRRAANRGNAISLFVRNKISAEAYFSAIGQTLKRV